MTQNYVMNEFFTRKMDEPNCKGILKIVAYAISVLDCKLQLKVNQKSMIKEIMNLQSAPQSSNLETKQSHY